MSAGEQDAQASGGEAVEGSILDGMLNAMPNVVERDHGEGREGGGRPRLAAAAERVSHGEACEDDAPSG